MPCRYGKAQSDITDAIFKGITMMLLITDLVLLGAIVVVGYLAGELIGKVNLPKVLGYLVVGMVVGPFALNLVRPDIFSTDMFELAILLAIGFVGYAIGSGIHVQELKSAGTKMIGWGCIYSTWRLPDGSTTYT
jgi:Kef-type K+ transport system membrane component KefB